MNSTGNETRPMEYRRLPPARVEQLAETLSGSWRSHRLRAVGQVVSLFVGGVSLFFLVLVLARPSLGLWSLVVALAATGVAGYAMRNQVLAIRLERQVLVLARATLQDQPAELHETELAVDRLIEVTSRVLARAGWLVGTSGNQWFFLEDATRHRIAIRKLAGSVQSLVITAIRGEHWDYVVSVEGLSKEKSSDLLMYDSEDPLERRGNQEAATLARLVPIVDTEISRFLESVNSGTCTGGAVRVAAGSAGYLRRLMEER